MKAVSVLALAFLALVSAGCTSPSRSDSKPPAFAPNEAPQRATSLPRPTPILPTAGPQLVFAASTIDLKVREGPGTGYKQIGVLRQGTRVQLIGISQDSAWFEHERGWSAGAYLTTESDTSILPVVLVAPVSQPQPAQQVAPPSSNCDSSYPTVCIPPPPPDLDCGNVSFRRFQVLPPDRHRFDGDHDGIGCES